MFQGTFPTKTRTANQRLLLSVLHCIYVIKFQLENLLSTYHIFNYFDFQSLFSYKPDLNVTEVFHLKIPIQVLHFCQPLNYSLQVLLVSSSYFLPSTDQRNPTILVWFSICLTHINLPTVLGPHQLDGVIAIITISHFTSFLFEHSIGLVKFSFWKFSFYAQIYVLRLQCSTFVNQRY